MTFVVEINGKTMGIEISREMVDVIKTEDNLIKILSQKHNTDDVKILGLCEA